MVGGGGFCFVTGGEFSEQGYQRWRVLFCHQWRAGMVGGGGFCFVTSGEFSEQE